MRNNPSSASAATATLNSLRDTGDAVIGRVQSSKAGSSSLSKGGSSKPQRQLLVGEVPVEEEPINNIKSEKARKKAEAKREKQRQKEEELRRQQEEAAARERELAEKYSIDDPADVEKRLKKLRKKLRQLDALKQKDPSTLLPEQKAKLGEEAKVFRLISELEARLNELTGKK